MTKSSGLTDQHKTKLLKEKLLECLSDENEKFASVVQSFFDKSRKEGSDIVSVLEATIQSVDNILSAGDWESSLFLRSQAKKILLVKSEAEKELKKLQQSERTIFSDHLLAEDEREVYISLFQSDAYNMEKWAMQLRSLSQYIIGRPVYANESDVQKRVRLRAALGKEAYVIVVIKKSAVKAALFDASPKDQFGHPLLNLADSALESGEITWFVHQNVRYRFVDGALQKAL